MRTVYFVCHGNTCRSPMAAEIFRHILKARGGPSVGVDCFGTNPYYPDNPEVKRLREAAVTEVMGGLNELSSHVPKGIGDVSLCEQDILVMLNPPDLPVLKELVARTGAEPRLIVWDIEDPFTKPLAKYIESARSMRTAIERNFTLLSGASGSRQG
jgi:protein-tyrosine-phosphatase